MKYFIFLSIILSAAVYAQKPTTTEKSVDQFSLSQKEFSNLPEEKRNEFKAQYTDAQRFLSTKRVFEALEALDKAEKVFPNSVEIFTLRGACYVEMRILDKAELAFKRALEISPKNSSVMFNLAECMFVSRQWQSAHDVFQELLRMAPANSTELARLIEFKILLCKKKLGLDQEVKILAEKYDYQDDSPYYYYSKAVIAFDNKEVVEAEQWMARASRIFVNPNTISPWQDTMMEYGYIKSFFGSPEKLEEEP